MIPILEEKSSEVAELCRRPGVAKLDVFGSAATGAFRPGSSDLDFIADFHDHTPGTYLDRYLDLAEGLESIFGLPVDLLTEQGVARKPRFRDALATTRRPIYEA